MFITLCENKTSFLIDAGYIFWLECRSSNYERIAWKNRNVIIAIAFLNISASFSATIHLYITSSVKISLI